MAKNSDPVLFTDPNVEALGPDVEAIEASAAQDEAELQQEATARDALVEAQEKAVDIVDAAQAEADQIRAALGLRPVEDSPGNEVEGGTVEVKYLGTSDRFYVGNDSEGRAVYAQAGGDAVKVSEDAKVRLFSLPHDTFEVV